MKALQEIISITANHKETFSIMHIDVSRAYFHTKAQRPVLIRLPVEDRMGTDAGKVGLMKKSMYVTRDAASNWERDWQEHVKNWLFRLGLSSKNLFHHKENRVSHRANKETDGVRGKDDECVSNQSEDHRLWVTEEHQNVEQEIALVKARNCFSA